MTILTVGAGKAFPTLAKAVAAAHSGDDIQVSAGTYTNDFPATVSKLTIEGVGGMAKFVATQHPPNGKAQFVTTGNVTIRNVEVSGVAVSDENGAAVRYQGGNLTLDHVYLHDNQEGLLAPTIQTAASRFNTRKSATTAIPTYSTTSTSTMSGPRLLTTATFTTRLAAALCSEAAARIPRSRTPG